MKGKLLIQFRRHGGVADSAVALQQEGPEIPELTKGASLCRVCKLSRYMCRFSLGTPVSSQSPEMRFRLLLILCRCKWLQC